MIKLLAGIALFLGPSFSFAEEMANGDEITYVGIGPGGNGETVLGLHERPVSRTYGSYWAERPKRKRGAPPYSPPADWQYNTTSSPVEGKINVHIVSHSHDDTGWQVTVDQYHYREVYYVIDTVVKELAYDPNRHFTFVETAFFARWWEMQSSKMQNLAKKLVANGQLEFINGGWCMHDEASPLYTEMVDQTTRGHQFLKRHFGIKPRGTWQVDPFGHSQTQAWLMSAECGMESLFWGRTDYQDFNARKEASKLEWIWEGSESLGSSAQVFAGALFGTGGGGYSTWVSFDGTDNQIQDDPRRHDFNVDQWVDKVVQSAFEQDAHTRTSHQLWAAGTDFQYQNADHWYTNLDKLVHYVNLNGTINVMYSTPSKYVDAKKAAGLKWEVRRDDVMPLADNAHHYWTGYFTSRPSLKRQVRRASSFLTAARQLEVLSGVGADEVDTPTTRPSPVVGGSWTDSLEGTIGVATHHDGMSGTGRQSVVCDYEERIAESYVESEAGVRLALAELLGLAGGDDGASFASRAGARAAVAQNALESCDCGENVGGCLNMSVCAATTDHEEGFGIVAWNTHARTLSAVVSLPVRSSTGANDTWAVTDVATGAAVASQLVPLDERTLALPMLYVNSFGLSDEELAAEKARRTNNATHTLLFRAEMPPLGFATYRASRTQGSAAAEESAAAAAAAAPTTVSNGVYELSFNGANGALSAIKNLKSGASASLGVEWGWYNSSTGGCTPGIEPYAYSCDGQKSGMYMFRPNSSTLFKFGGEYANGPLTEVVQGDVVTEVRQTFSKFASHVIRLYKDSPFVELEWTAGPIPMNTPWMADHGGDTQEWGKELIVRYTTDLASDKTFYADSNGREMVRREVDQRGPAYPQPYNVSEPIAGNYYPVNSMLSLDDGATELAVVTDATSGGASLRDGELELMVHRRVMQDDSRGVQEPLNETMCGCNDINAAPGHMGQHGVLGDGGCWCEGLTMRGKHWLVLDTVHNAHATRRQLLDELSFAPTLLFSPDPAFNPPKHTFSALSAPLPANVRLVTLTSNYAEFNDGAVLLRLAHTYGVGEHPELSKPATVSLAEVFGASDLKITSAEEVSLTANMGIDELDKIKANFFKPEDGETQIPTKRARLNPRDVGLEVTLLPMEIKTFWVHFEK